MSSQDKQCLQFQIAQELASCMDELCFHVALHVQATSHWDAFMLAWQKDVLKVTRKDLSHYGALPTTFPWEPEHWTPLLGDAKSASAVREWTSGDAKSASGARDWYFDAGNDVYALSIQMLFPNATTTQFYNVESLGDVLEAVLGVCWICRVTTSLATLLTRASKYLYGLKSCLALESFKYQENREKVRTFISEHSQFQREEQSAARGSGATTGTSGAYVSAVGCVEHERSSPGGAASTSGVALPTAWFEEFERDYLHGLLQTLQLRNGTSALLAMCDEAYNMPTDDVTEHVSNNALDGATEHVPTTTQAIIFSTQDVPAFIGKQGGSTKAAHKKLNEKRDEYEKRLSADSPGFQIDLSTEDWWKVWISKAKFSRPLDELLGDGVVQFVFEALPWPDKNLINGKSMLRTDFTLVTLRRRVRLHPGSNGEAKPVFVDHNQDDLPRGTIAQSTCPHQLHHGYSQHDLLSDKEAWTWAARQTRPKDITRDRSKASLPWERWLCHASWAKDLAVLNLGIAFFSDADNPMVQNEVHFWCRAARGDALIYITAYRKNNKTVVYPVSRQRYVEFYAPLHVCSDGTSYY